MYIRICIYTYIYTYIFIYIIYVYMYIFIYLYMYICIYALYSLEQTAQQGVARASELAAHSEQTREEAAAARREVHELQGNMRKLQAALLAEKVLCTSYGRLYRHTRCIYLCLRVFMCACGRCNIAARDSRVPNQGAQIAGGSIHQKRVFLGVCL